MTHDQMMDALTPVRLPLAMARLSLPEMLALIGIGLIAGLVVAAVILPFTRRRGPRDRTRLADLRAVPVPQRLLQVSRLLGHLPTPLRRAAYGAEPPPSDRRIEGIARRARLRRLWRR